MKYRIVNHNIKMEHTPFDLSSLCWFPPATLSDGFITIEVKEGGECVRKKLFVPIGSIEETIKGIAENGAKDVAVEIRENIKKKQMTRY
jgi:hypothetical protein